ncbi:MAG: copper-translocating P-type ATPase [Gemmatimonadota bacterium]
MRHEHETPAAPAQQHEHAGHDGRDTHAAHPVHETQAGHGSREGHGSRAGHEAHAGHEARAGHATRPEHGSHAGHAARPEHGSHAGHDKHAGHSPGMFRDKFWLSLALTIPTLVWGHMLPRLLGYTPPMIPGSHWIAPLFGTAVFLYGGWPFLVGAVHELRARLPGMMTLIALAISVAFVFSAAVTLGYEGMPLWEELATLVTIMLLGHWIEMRSISQAEGALAELAKLLPNTATRLVRDPEGERSEDVPLSALQDGDIVLVRPGANVPVDGKVLTGESSLNESMITGESRLVEKREGDLVIAGTINGAGSLRVEVTGTGDRTTLAGIMRLVAQAQTSRSRAQALADRAAFWLTIVALGSGVVTLIAWLAAGAEVAYAVERTVTVLVIACPHALGLAVPLVIAISTTLGARSGLLVRDRRGLEEARLVDTVVFDKTGTLTLGAHRVVGMSLVAGQDERGALRLTAAAEQDSEHPLAQAIGASARDRSVPVPAAHGFRAIPGHGVEAHVEGRHVAVGGPNLLDRHALVAPGELQSFADAAAGRGESVIYLVVDGAVRAAFAVADAIRPESKEAVARLHALGIEVAIMTGDSQAVADAVARELGIDTVLAQVLPEGKAARIEELQARGKRVAMGGDGVNYAPALVTADVWVAIGAGTDVAVEAGDVVLVRSDPRDVARIVTLSRASYRKMVQNLWWAAGYNIVAIPLAAGVLAAHGLVLSPAVGAVLMSLSTVIVALNAQLLRRADL